MNGEHGPPGVPTGGVPNVPTDGLPGVLTDGPPAIPTGPQLAAEMNREQHSECWLFVREVAIVLLLISLLVTHALLL